MTIASNWINALLGGVLIGTSATLLLAVNGRIAGISGILNQLIQRQPDNRVWSGLFLLGLLVGGGIYGYILAPQSRSYPELTAGSVAIAGFLVGVGTRMSNGCTSGHGVCGLGRLSPRSLVAVLTFLTTAMMTVFVTHHLG